MRNLMLVSCLIAVCVSIATATPYDAALAAMKSLGAPQVKELDTLILQPSGTALLSDARATALLNENEDALNLFRQAAEESSDGYLFAPKHEKLSESTGALNLVEHIKLFKLLLLDAKLKVARKRTGAAEKDLLAAVGFLGQLSKQKSGAMIASMVGQFCLQKAFPLLADSLRGAASASYLRELSVRLAGVERNQDSMQTAFLEMGAGGKAIFRERLTPEAFAIELAKLPLLRRLAAQKLEDAAFFSTIYAMLDASVDEETQARIEAFRTNAPEHLVAFEGKRMQDLHSRMQERAKQSEWSKSKYGLDGGASLKQTLLESVVDATLFVARPAYDKLVPRYHLHLCRLNVLRAGLAVKLYQCDHKGLPPNDISQVVPDYLASIPRDSFNGFRPLSYARTGKRFLVYSLGPDGKDDHGSAALDGEAYMNDPVRNAGDIVFADELLAPDKGEKWTRKKASSAVK